jgi:D-glycero-D-manno-heptose 1,7-bisphosphate phosphatase
MSTTPIIEVRSARREGIRFDTPGRQGAILMDRDGVLNSIEDGFVTSADKMRKAIIPGSMEALARLERELPEKFKGVMSNQAGLDEGFMTSETNREIMEVLADSAEAAGGPLDAIYYCPNGLKYQAPTGEESARKEHGGMFFALAHEMGDKLDLADSYYIGDMTTDMAAAKEAYPGMTTILVLTGFAGKDGKSDVKPDVVCKDMSAAADYIIARERNLRLTNA